MVGEAQGCSRPCGAGDGSGCFGAVGEGFRVHQSLPAGSCRVSPSAGTGGHSPEPGCAREGGFGEDSVLCPGIGWAWWHLLTIPSKAWWHQLRVPSQVWWLHIVVPSQGCASKRSILIILTAAPLSSSSAEQSIPPALPTAVALVRVPRFGGLRAGGSLSP